MKIRLRETIRLRSSIQIILPGRSLEEIPSYKLEVPAGAHYFINMAEWTTKDGETRLMETDRFEEGEYELYVTYEAKEGI